jgi:hypothetical protein
MTVGALKVGEIDRERGGEKKKKKGYLHLFQKQSSL